MYLQNDSLSPAAPKDSLRSSLFRIFGIALFAAALLALQSSRPGFAQTSADGTIHGRVADSSGAALGGANIVAHSSAVGGTFKAISDAEGNYRLIELPAGT